MALPTKIWKANPFLLLGKGSDESHIKYLYVHVLLPKPGNTKPKMIWCHNISSEVPTYSGVVNPFSNSSHEINRDKSPSSFVIIAKHFVN